MKIIIIHRLIKYVGIVVHNFLNQKMERIAYHREANRIIDYSTKKGIYNIDSNILWSNFT